MFAKIFQSMYDGSLGTRGPWEALVTFQQLLVLSDRFGDVDITAEVISRRTLIPLEIIEKGIEELSKPDPNSRDPANDGRRIVPISPTRTWGWHIVNYTRYAAIRSAEERREYMAAYYDAKKHAKEPEPPPEPEAKAPKFSPPDWVPIEQWLAWLEVRRRIKAPNTDRALKLAVKDMDELRTAGHDPGAVLDLAITRGWRGLFAPKGNGETPAVPPGHTCRKCGSTDSKAWIDGMCSTCWDTR